MEVSKILRKLEPVRASKDKVRSLQEGKLHGRLGRDDIKLLEGIYVENGKATAYNGTLLATLRTVKEQKFFVDYEGNIIDREFNSKEIFALTKQFRPNVKFELDYMDFMKVLKIISLRKELIVDVDYDNELNKLNFYYKYREAPWREVIARVDLIDSVIPKGFTFIGIHSNRNLYELLMLNHADTITMLVDTNSNFIKYVCGDLEVLMGCNADNFQVLVKAPNKDRPFGFMIEVEANEPMKYFYNRNKMRGICFDIEEHIKEKFGSKLNYFHVDRTYIEKGIAVTVVDIDLVKSDEALFNEIIEAVKSLVIGFRV